MDPRPARRGGAHVALVMMGLMLLVQSVFIANGGARAWCATTDLTEVRELLHCDDGLCLCHLAAFAASHTAAGN